MTTIIYALVSPLFKYVIGSNQLTPAAEILRGYISYVGTGVLVLAVTGSDATIKNVWIYLLRHVIYSDIPCQIGCKARALNNTGIMPFF